MTFAEFVNSKYPNINLTPWQVKAIHQISSGQSTVFSFGRMMGRATVMRLYGEYLNEKKKTEPASTEEPQDPV